MSSNKKPEPEIPAGEVPAGETPAGQASETEQPVEAEVTEEKPAEKTPEPSAEEKLTAELAAEKDKYLRLAAEYDNFRRRSAQERDRIYADVKADTIGKILPIYDNLERALKQETADEAYRKGVELTLKAFDEAMKSMGVKPIEALGKTFDPTLHNAVMHTEDETKGEGEIVQEFQKGFLMGERVIRFSMVQVAN